MAGGISNYSLARLISIIDSRVNTGAGDITAVTAGTGLSGGGISGAVTLNLDASELSALGTTASNSDYIVIVDATDNSTKKVLVSNLPAASIPAGSDTQFQYNDGGAFGGASNLVYNDSTGYVGIGVAAVSTTHALTLPESDTNAGKIKATAYTTYSSERFKENIKPIKNPLQIINNLEGVTFDWKNTQSPDIGFVAEQVGKHLPNIVDWEENGVDAQSMDYSKIVPILVEAIKNQQSQIDKLKEQIISLINILKAD